MAEGMPPDPITDSCCDRCGADVVLLNVMRQPRLAGVRIREHPIPNSYSDRLVSPEIQKHLGELRIERDFLPAVLGLHIIDSASNNATLNADVKFVPIHITPLQADDFAHTQTEAC